MLELIRSLYAYNSWATQLLLGALGSLSAEELDAPGCSGNGSIRQTLAHLMRTQKGWFSWFDGSLSPMEAYGLQLDPAATETVLAAAQLWQGIDAQTSAVIAQLDEEKLAVVWTAQAGGGGLSLPLWQLLTHVANHGAHTRAQIVAAIRRAGHDPGNVDYLNYALGR